MWLACGGRQASAASAEIPGRTDHLREAKMVGRPGIEPGTNRLKGECSTTELAARCLLRRSALSGPAGSPFSVRLLLAGAGRAGGAAPGAAAQKSNISSISSPAGRRRLLACGDSLPGVSLVPHDHTSHRARADPQPRRPVAVAVADPHRRHHRRRPRRVDRRSRLAADGRLPDARRAAAQDAGGRHELARAVRHRRARPAALRHLLRGHAHHRRSSARRS